MIDHLKEHSSYIKRNIVKLEPIITEKINENIPDYYDRLEEMRY